MPKSDVRPEPDPPLAAVLATIEAGVVVRFADGRTGICNPAAERILGLTRRQILGREAVGEGWRTVREDGSDLPVEERPAEVVLRTGRVCDLVMGIDGPGGRERRWISATARPIGGDRVGHPPEAVVTTFTPVADADARGRPAADETILREVTECVARGAPIEETLSRIAEEAGGLMAADLAGIISYGPGPPTVVGLWSRHAPSGAGEAARDERGGSRAEGRVWHRSGDVARFEVRLGDDSGSASQFLREGVAAPIRLDGRLWGCISLIREDHGAPAFDPGTEARLGRFADLASLALEVAMGRDRLREQARTDPVTGLPHAGVFHERLEEEVQRALRHDIAMSLVLVDLDGFRNVNLRHGHAAGDRVLAAIGRRLSGEARGHDVVARTGGEEFALILPETALAPAVEAARRILGVVAAPAAGARITACAGVAVLEEGDDGGSLLRRASAALARAKATGRGKVQAAPTRRERRLAPLRGITPS
jgi:diguanylate cyclase (GGDEF)-like protein